MRKIFRRILRFFLLALVFLGTWLLLPRELDSVNDFGDGLHTVPEYSMLNVRYVIVKESNVDMELFSDQSEFDYTNRLLKNKNIRAKFYDDHGQSTDVKADTGAFSINENRLVLQKNIHSKSPDGFQSVSEDAIYNVQSKQVTMPSKVHGFLEDKSVQVWGDRAEGSLNTDTLHLIGNATAHYMESRRGLLKVRGNKAEYQRGKQEIQFQEDVKIEQGEIKGTSRIASVYYAKAPNSLKYLIAKDDVEISGVKGRKTRSQVAEFDASRDTVVLTGFPSAIDGDDVVNGDKITMYRATGVIEATAANAAVGSSQDLQKSKKTKLSEEDKELIP